MGRYVDDILQPGEKLLYSTNAHWIFFLPALGLWTVAAVFLALSGMVPAGSPLMLVCWAMAAIMALIALYNRLGEVSAELGKLVVEGDLTKPSVVMFVGGVKATVPELKVKAFPLKGISEKAWPSLQEDIARASDIARSRMDAYYDHQHVPRDFNATVLFQGDVRINRNTSLLVATGSETYVEMVESTVTAYQANQRAGLGGSAPTPAK